ncbi:gamma carbonic anhydrase family protein [Deinococcus roseus]|uniref:Gamma carbonic anhydrase family protein n=1 Tax=Deinococcus roseus TaxID=392414 RepID=A0ABQ2CXG2_9DEIO|nr:gamma carbonic anhydrase family protein [Deinococcus roseus]GGJ23300.1 hypothetical protein GCM10008938_06850 [Deinococcus roseus]
MPFYELAGEKPKVARTAWIAPSADVIGKVTIGDHASVWFGVVLRGDVEAITIGEGSNVQDGAVLHSDPGFPCVLHQNVTVGHRAIVHGATLHEGSLVGMGAIMLNGSSLGKGAMLAAGALLKEGQHIEDGMLAVGVPAKVIKVAPPTQNAQRYQQNAQRYQSGCVPITEAEEP